jgi:hypothetical protein
MRGSEVLLGEVPKPGIVSSTDSVGTKRRIVRRVALAKGISRYSSSEEDEETTGLR